jgi:hypothetical protein
MAQIVQPQHNGGDEQQAASQAREQVQQATGQAREQARSKAREQMDQRSTEAGQRIRSQAGDIRSVAGQLREQGKDQPAKIAEQAADRIERAGSWLEQADADRILRDIEDFARRQPWAVALGAATLGFAAARFLKASSGDRYERRFSDPSYARTGSVGGGYATGYGQGTTADVTIEPAGGAPASPRGPR